MASAAALVLVLAGCAEGEPNASEGHDSLVGDRDPPVGHETGDALASSNDLATHDNDKHGPAGSFTRHRRFPIITYDWVGADAAGYGHHMCDRNGTSTPCYWRNSVYSVKSMYFNEPVANENRTWRVRSIPYSFCWSGLDQQGALPAETVYVCMPGFCRDVSDAPKTITNCRGGEVDPLDVYVHSGDWTHVEIFVQTSRPIPNPVYGIYSAMAWGNFIDITDGR